MLDALMPKLDLKETQEAPVADAFEDVVPANGAPRGPVDRAAEVIVLADGVKAALRRPVDRTQGAEVIKPTAVNDVKLDWRGTSIICCDSLQVGICFTLFPCCCQSICTPCCKKWRLYDKRCPLCRSATPKDTAERVRWLQKHVDKGNAEAQVYLGDAYSDGDMGLKKKLKRTFQLYERAAAQGHAIAQFELGRCYAVGQGVRVDYETAALWYRRAAEQGEAGSQYNLGNMFDDGRGVAQSHDEAARWWRLAAAQGQPTALFNLGACYLNGGGAPQNLHEALRLYKRAAAKGHAKAAAQVRRLAARSGQTD